MNTATIEKCIDLLNTGKIDDLRDLLNYERETDILASKGIKTSLLNAVKKIVCDNGLKECVKHLRAYSIHRTESNLYATATFSLNGTKNSPN